jgi:hypothetical protein
MLSDYANAPRQYVSHRRLNMTIKPKIAFAAVLFSAIASPSFAGDQDSAALRVSDGRVLGTHFTGAYASAKAPTHATWWAEMSINDRLSQGHN